MPETNLIWKTIEEHVVFRNEYVGLRNDRVCRPDGVEATYGVIENRDFCTVFCKTRAGLMPIIQQYRYPWGEMSWELPSGIIERGEKPERAAAREVKEETGAAIEKLHFLGKAHPFGMAKGWAYLYYAEVGDVGAQHLDPSEFLRLHMLSPETWLSWVAEGKVTHAPSLLATFWAQSQDL